MTALAVRDLRVEAADGATLLADVDLEVAAGERVLVVGASGSGKSTLLRVLAGLAPAPGATVSGSVVLAGQQVVGRDLEAPPLDVGWLPQDPAAAVCLPVVEDDVAFGCENRRRTLEEIESAVLRALTAVGAQGWRRRDSTTLSSGQAQRVGLAAAVAPAPAVLLLDEPSAMLDPLALRGVRAAVERVVSGPAPPAVLLVEHRLDEWADGGALPERVVVLDGGRIVADGPTEQVWARHGAALAAGGVHLPWPVERGLGGALDPAPAEPGDGPTLLRARVAVGHGPTVLADVDLQVRAGEVVAVIGPNGCGKSTLLLTLAGLLRPRRGTVDRPGGHPALVFARPELQFLAPTVAAELAHDGAAPDAVAAMLAALRLERAAERSVHRLSGGEQRRLSVGVALLGARSTILADEPTFGLDRAGVAWVGSALRGAAADGRGVVVTSHDLRFVAEVASRVVVLGEGRVLDAGTTTAVLARCRDAGPLPVPAAIRDRLRSAA